MIFGEIRVGSEPDRDRHSLEVKATSVDSSIEHRLYMGDAQDSLQLIGALGLASRVSSAHCAGGVTVATMWSRCLAFGANRP